MLSAQGYFDYLESSWILRYGMKSALERGCLNPLLRAIEVQLSISKQLKTSHPTIFSCDSFCEPHLDCQLAFLKHLSGRFREKHTFFNFPIAHFITSRPDLRLLMLTDEPVKLLEINRNLVEQQSRYSRLIPHESRLPSYSEDLLTFSHDYQMLVGLIEEATWTQVKINGFPIYELAHRDLSLTYKCAPSLTSKSDLPFYKHFVQICKLNLWLLCILALDRNIGNMCFAMSSYTATNLFAFFCEQTTREFRYLKIPSVDLEIFGLPQNSERICILRSPYSTIDLIKPSALSTLSKINLSPAVLKGIATVIDSRFAGKGVHTYSNALDHSSEHSLGYAEWISSERSRGRQIVTLFSSSPDELIGQQYGFKHFNIDLSHLGPSVFIDQDDWIQQVISHFSGAVTNASLIIRLHPRLAEDHRALPESPHLKQIIASLAKAIDLCSRIRLVHPADSVSSYWLGMQSDLILNGWSTIGLEFAIKGKIVTNAFYRCAMGAAAICPVHTGVAPLRSKHEYFNRVNRLLNVIRHNMLPNASDCITADEAAKAFIVTSTAGLVNLSEFPQLYSQVAAPQTLTPELLRLLCSQ